MIDRFFAAILGLFTGIIDAFVNLIYPRRAKRKVLSKSLAAAKDYGDWINVADQYDRLEKNDVWKLEKRTHMYDADLVQSRTTELRDARRVGDMNALTFLLRGGLDRGLGGMDNPRLYVRSFVGTKKIIEDYIEEVVLQLHYIQQSPDLPMGDKLKFFRETRQAYGRSALLLSGGAGMGMLHFGVVKCLYEFNLLPRVVSGSSIGALVTGFLGTHTDEELARFFDPGAINFGSFDRLGNKGTVRRKLARILKHGVLMDINKLMEFCHDNFGHTTFLEAYQKTKRIINVTVGATNDHENPHLLNYLTAPNVLIASACGASCASPGIYEAVEIMAKNLNGEIVKWNPLAPRSGKNQGPTCDLPMDRLAELFNVNHFIVSQVNPHVVPFIPATKKMEKRYRGIPDAGKRLLLNEVYHRFMQFMELGFVPKPFQSLISQRYHGDITIVPDLDLLTTLSCFLSNPNENKLVSCMYIGERSTWPYITTIRSRCKIELTLDLCFQKTLREQQAAADRFLHQ